MAVAALVLLCALAPLVVEVKNEILSPALSNNLKLKTYTSDILPELLHRSNKGTCGIPNIKCTTGCYQNKNGCYCNQSKGDPWVYVHPCRENSKICKAGDYKLFDYSKINPHHSAALTANPTCNKIRQGITDQEKILILETHNNLRAKIARGAESRSPQQGVHQPSGSNIKELIWNDELAYIAQKWADQCNFNHDQYKNAPCSRPYDDVGQNLYRHATSRVNKVNRWAAAINGWYDEVADTPVSNVNKYSGGVTSKMIGHYAQLVWAETFEMGCGAVYHKGGKYRHGSTTLYVCNYGTAGNVKNLEMYKIGRPATECGKSGKSTKYPGLCATTL